LPGAAIKSAPLGLELRPVGALPGTGGAPPRGLFQGQGELSWERTVDGCTQGVVQPRRGVIREPRATPGVVGQKQALSPEGASQNYAAPLMRPFRAPLIFSRVHPGRCPGLQLNQPRWGWNCVPLGLFRGQGGLPPGGSSKDRVSSAGSGPLTDVPRGAAQPRRGAPLSQPLPQRLGHRSGTIVHLQLRVNPAQIAVDRVHAQLELRCQLLVGEPGHNQLQNLVLALA
jgi:hypothetical protein